MLNGYYRTPSLILNSTSSNVTGIVVWRCAQHASCRGGLIAGSASCADGHTGALCGACLEGYYRGLVRCEPCESTANESRLGVQNSFLVAGLMAAMGLTAACRYLWSDAISCRCLHPLRQRQARLGSRVWQFLRLTSQRMTAGAAFIRVAVGYCQTIGVFRRLLRVQWPRPFVAFLQALDQLSPDFLSLIPAECVAGRPLNFIIHLGVTMALPIVTVLLLVLLSVIIAPCTGRWLPREGLRKLMAAIYQWPQVWDLASWVLLLQYPVIARKSVQAFDCTPYEDDQLLRSDPTLSCHTSEWYLGAAMAAAGIVSYCLGMPLAAVLITRRHLRRGGNQSARRRLVHVLTRSYRDECAWFMEGLDLFRKFLLTGAVYLISPNTRLQLLFGNVVGLLFLLLDQKLQPFRSPSCGAVQTAAHLQLVFTYAVAQLFFVDDALAVSSSIDISDDRWGVLVIGANSVAFVLILWACCQGLSRIVTELKGDVLQWADGTSVELAPPRTNSGYHLFLSHVCDLFGVS